MPEQQETAHTQGQTDQPENQEKIKQRRFNRKTNWTIAGLVGALAIVIFGLSAFGTGREATEAEEDKPLIDLNLNQPEDLGLQYDPEKLIKEALKDPDSQRLHQKVQDIVYE
jgi:hypothetical protein